MTFFQELEDMGMFDDVVGRGQIGEPVTVPTYVYRIEMPNGMGPFNSGLGRPSEIYDAICNGCLGKCDALAENEQMGVTEAAFRAAHGHADYGCDSIDAIHNWFPEPARKYLAKKWGAKLMKYEVAPGQYLMQVENGEIVFDMHSAKVVDALDL